MKKCIKCQEEIADDAAFCPFCGTKQPEKAEPSETKADTEEVTAEETTETKPAEPEKTETATQENTAAEETAKTAKPDNTAAEETAETKETEAPEKAAEEKKEIEKTPAEEPAETKPAEPEKEEAAETAAQENTATEETAVPTGTEETVEAAEPKETEAAAEEKTEPEKKPAEETAETKPAEEKKQEESKETAEAQKKDTEPAADDNPQEEKKEASAPKEKIEEKKEQAEEKIKETVEKVKKERPKADVDWKSYLMPFWEVIKDPFAAVSLPWVDAGIAILLSLIVNTWLTRSFAVSALEFVLQAVGRTDINVSIAMNNMGYTFSSFFQCGMVMTVIVIAFLFLARFISERKTANAGAILQEICGSVFFTSLLALLTIIFSAITPVLGTFGVLCLLVYEVLILHQDMKNTNGWLQLIILTLFLILQVLAVYHMMPTNAWF
ncbi:MAG: zinc-ribbon domain-containing protein [Lactimicrobium sp.]|jgi:hypothetical protein|uniref:zinc ribbon domain-containing protein n=1 Tax=Lactimicrobium sp. TaxID=2563780 RepID=UPI002F35F6D0